MSPFRRNIFQHIHLFSTNCLSYEVDCFEESFFDVRTFWSKKLRAFGAKSISFKVYGVSARTRGVSALSNILWTRGKGGQFFCNFVRTSYMDFNFLRPFWFLHKTGGARKWS